MTDRQLFQLVLRQLQHTIAYSNEEMKVLDDLKGLVRERLSQPEPEPVAWYGVDDYDKKYLGWDKHDLLDEGFAWITPLYTAPPKRKWVGLTRRDIDIAFDDTQEGGGFYEFAYAIEAKLKEKNT